MLKFVVLCFLIAAVRESIPCDVNGPIPKQDPPIDMGKFKGTWYETLTTIDPIAMNHVCLKAYNFRTTLNPPGFEAGETFYYDNGPGISDTVHALRTPSGNFIQRYVEQNETMGYEADENGNMDLQAASEYSEFEWKEYALLGDPDHYVAYVICLSRGWLAWVYTKEKAITPELFVYVHNDLLKHGLSVPWRQTRCQNI